MISIGKHNPLLADIRKAVHHGALTSAGLLPVEGPRLVHEAHRSGMKIVALLVREGIPPAQLPRGEKVYTLDSSTFKAIQDTEHSQGVLALVHPKLWSLEDVLSQAPRPVVVLGGLQDPGNVGTILRVAESFGAAGCVGLAGTVSVYNAKVGRASAGSIFRLPHLWDVDLEVLSATLKSRKISLVGTSPHADQSIVSWDWTQPVALLMGNEGAGLSSVQATACETMLSIPQERSVESLNTALATAVILYEAYRRRNFP